MSICKYCGKEFSKRGIRLHQMYCKEKGGSTKQVQEVQAEESKPKKNNIAVCPSCKESDNVRVLKKSDEHELYIINQGWNFICEKCEEVFK